MVIRDLLSRNRRRWALAIAAVLTLGLQSAVAMGADWKNSEVTELQDRLDDSISNVDGISSHLGNLNNLQDFTNRVNTVRQQIQDSDILEFLDQSHQQIEAALDEQSAGMPDFLGNNCDSSSPCGQFKTNLADMFGNLQQISETLLQFDSASSTTFGINFKTFTDLIQAAPGQAVYPLYVAMTAGSNLFQIDLGSYFGLVDTSVKDVNTGVRMPSIPTGGGLPTVDLPDQCYVIMDSITPQVFQRDQHIVSGSSVFLKVVATVLKARGQIGFTGYRLGVHGYIGGHLKNNPKKKIGLVLEGIADALGMVSGHASNMLRYCTIVRSKQQIMDVVLKNQFPGNGPQPK